ncbi:MAG: penicillin-binding transpeptidase domain-containing protein, partial [Bacteroidota bacterium]
AMYLNKFNFINGAFGIKAAAEIYFGQGQDSLSVEQAATLVGMLKNPSLFNPIKRPDTTMHRRMVVLKQMQKNKIISQTEYDSLRALPLDMGRFKRKTHADGLAPYFRMELRKELSRILDREENRKTDGEKYNIFSDGIKVYTTIDPVMQEHAEKAMIEHMSKLQKKFWKTWKDKDPWNYRDPYRESDENRRVIKAAQKALRKDIQETERFEAIKERMLDEQIAEISKQIDGFKLRTVDIERMLAEESEKGSLARLVSRKMVGSKLAVKYRKIMDSPDWHPLKMAYRAFQQEVERIFHEPVPMKVFAYNGRLEKDTVLSPYDSIRYHRMFLQLGSIAVDPITGHVKAWVGGINHRYFQYDHVTSLRQVGSTFKPFIYATAIAQQGISPCFTVYDLPYTIHVDEGNFNLIKDWTPKNADGEYTAEPYSLFRGLMTSRNTVSVFLMKQLGDVEPVRSLVSNMGLSRDLVPAQPSICLGSSDLTVQQLTGAYTTFANNGTYNKPVFITRIEDKNGRVIYQEQPIERRSLNPNHNYVMVQMLKRVVGVGLPLFGGIKSEMGGKTGTTNNYVDGWFVGLTPDLVVGTWVGGDQNWIRFRTLSEGTGAKMARPFFARFLKRIEQDPEADYNAEARFPTPSGDIGIELDCEVYNRDGGIISNGNEYFDEEENESFGDDHFGDESPLRDSTENEDF